MDAPSSSSPRYLLIGAGALILAYLPARSMYWELSNWDALGGALRVFDVAFAGASIALAAAGVALVAAPRFFRQALRAAGVGGIVMGGGQIVGMLLGVVPCSGSG